MVDFISLILLSILALKKPNKTDVLFGFLFCRIERQKKVPHQHGYETSSKNRSKTQNDILNMILGFQEPKISKSLHNNHLLRRRVRGCIEAIE